MLASAYCVLIVLISYVSSEVKTYNIGADSTLPSVPKKRKFENDTDEEDVKPKIPKTELTGKAILKKYFSLPKFIFFLEHQILPCRAQMFVQLCPRLSLQFDPSFSSPLLRGLSPRRKRHFMFFCIKSVESV